MQTTGVKTMTVNRATDFTPQSESSDLAIIIVITNSDNHGVSTLATTPDQNVDTPVEAPATIINPTDSGSGSDAVSTSVAQSNTVTDSGSGADAVSITATTQLTVTDTGSGADAITQYNGEEIFFTDFSTYTTDLAPSDWTKR